jgi:hypothetical protein
MVALPATGLLCAARRPDERLRPVYSRPTGHSELVRGPDGPAKVQPGKGTVSIHGPVGCDFST